MPSDLESSNESRGEKFPRSCRLRKRSDYRRAFATGRRRSGPSLQLVVAPNDESCPRLGLAVGRKVGNAVARNIIKRRLREIFRRNRGRLPAASDIVIIVRPGATRRSFDQLRSEFLECVDALKAGPRGRLSPTEIEKRR